MLIENQLCSVKTTLGKADAEKLLRKLKEQDIRTKCQIFRLIRLLDSLRSWKSNIFDFVR